MSDPLAQTALFSLLLAVTILFTTKYTNKDTGLSTVKTTYLKAFAVLLVIFGHTGYFLSTNHAFLYPLSIDAGVGVDIFLILSGYGLSLSYSNSDDTPLKFYAKRFKKIYIPMWLVLVALLVADALVLKKYYSLSVIVKGFLGIYDNIDIFTALNSPLWYFSLTVFLYLIFPIFYKKRYPKLSAIMIFVISVFILNLPLPLPVDLLKLFRLHSAAFSVGVFCASVRPFINKIKIRKSVLYLLTLLATVSFMYCSVHSGVGKAVYLEQVISILLALLFIFVIVTIPFDSWLLNLLGARSYEIYLIQWPLMYRYDFLYKTFPPYLATFLYLFLFLFIAVMLKKLVKLLATPFAWFKKDFFSQ